MCNLITIKDTEDKLWQEKGGQTNVNAKNSYQ